MIRLGRGFADVTEEPGHRVRAAPGVFVRLDDPAGHACLDLRARADDPFGGLGKIAALGIKVSRHCAYHGIALNVTVDLAYFNDIVPCGIADRVDQSALYRDRSGDPVRRGVLVFQADAGG